MIKKFCLDLTVSQVDRLSEKYVLIRLTDSRPLPAMLPGQFVEVRVDNSPKTFLRRPISIHFLDQKANELWLLVAVIGDGTRRLARLKSGDRLNCVLPLGNGFTLPASPTERFLLIGGGVGVAPLLFLGHQIKVMGGVPTFLLGARSASDLLKMTDFEALGRVFVTTEDGSFGERGFVTAHSILRREHFDFIATCGPKPMMQAVAKYARQSETPCEVSLENMMACGVGACLCCVEKSVGGYVCVCQEGPVFNINRLLWQI